MVALVTEDGDCWELPAGRPEDQETLEDTLRREIWEEACAEVEGARLLGFAQGKCVEGHELGLVLVRSFWRAEVTLHPWEPQCEILHRRLVLPAEVIPALALGDGNAISTHAR
jgi:8-oxo-dGTP pyrophosphatase MutT (NUDIX family)